MEKTRNTPASVILSKTKDGCEKILLSFSYKSVLNLILCFLFSSTTVFSSMSPLGLAFYTSVFSKKGWLLNYLASCVSVLVFGISLPWVYIASYTLITVVLAVVDFDFKLRRAVVSALSFFVLKLGYIAASGFVLYDFFALMVETAIIFACVPIFQKSIPVVNDINKRSYISSSESLSTMTLFSLAALSLSAYPAVFGFNPANVLSVLMIYIFSLSGINGEAVVLGVILGTVGTLESGSFASVTGSFAFGALLASAFASYGKIAVVLGFTIANTVSSIVLTDASAVAVSIYDSLMAAIIFAIIPGNICTAFSAVFKKTQYSACGSYINNRRICGTTARRLDEMSQSFRELSKIYESSVPGRELGNDYIMSKFREVTNSACAGCLSKRECFKNPDFRGYRYMSKMLETAFKNGKVSPSTLPSGFKSMCRRSCLFADKFNAMFNVIKTEKQWLTKLNDSRMLMSDQLLAISDAISVEKERCETTPDTNLEDILHSELDKAFISPSEIIAERDSLGDFRITVNFQENKINSEKLSEMSKIISAVTGKKTNHTTPVRHGEYISYSFVPAHNFVASIGYAGQTKNGEKISGDSLKFLSTDGKTLHILLSDGMGSGEAAESQSKTTVELMEKFLRAGFDSDTAVRLINSSLLLKSSRDIFSTIDLCSLNLCDAGVSFIKLGAASSYIKTNDKITAVSGSSLPAGILREIEVEKHFLSITGDTVIVIMSDGVADISLKNPACDGWVEKELESVNTANPQIIATRLIDKAVRLQKNQVHDDMTVAVLSVKKV